MDHMHSICISCIHLLKLHAFHAFIFWSHAFHAFKPDRFLWYLLQVSNFVREALTMWFLNDPRRDIDTRNTKEALAEAFTLIQRCIEQSKTIDAQTSGTTATLCYRRYILLLPELLFFPSLFSTVSSLVYCRRPRTVLLLSASFSCYYNEYV